MASLGMVFEDYPDDVICFVTDPKTGIQRRSKWPPTISEIVAACDEHISYLKKCERFKNWGKNDPLMIECPKEEKPTLDELKAKYGENWGIQQGEGKDRPVFGVSFSKQQLDSIADATPTAAAFKHPAVPKDWQPQAPSKEQLAAHYAHHSLGFVEKTS